MHMRSVVALLLVVGGLFLGGCNFTQQGQSLVSEPDKQLQEDGNLSIRIRIGVVGVLARTPDLSPVKLVVSAVGMDGYILLLGDTIDVSGPSWAGRYKVPEGLWQIKVEAMNQSGFVTHSVLSALFGIDDYTYMPIDLDLDLAARYSIAVFSIPVLDGMTRITIAEHYGRGAIDTLLGNDVRPGDTIRLAFDRIGASPEGEETELVMKIFGRVNGDERLIYHLNDVVTAVSGKNAPLSLKMSWVGGIVKPQENMSINVSIGESGTLDAKVSLQSPPTLSEFKGVVIDPRTGWQYDTRRIGNQVWMTRNIGPHEVSGYLERGVYFGDTIPEWYSSAPTESDTYADVSTACPSGWHVPDTSEWNELLRFAGGGAGSPFKLASERLRSGSGWITLDWSSEQDKYGEIFYVSHPVPYQGNDSLGFSLFPTFRELLNGCVAELWTSTPNMRFIHFNQNGVGFKNELDPEISMPRGITMFRVATSVRCIRNY